MALSSLRISCLCGSVAQLVTSRSAARARAPDADEQLSLCHCDACRHSTGLLCASYRPIAAPTLPQNIKEYQAADGWTRYFCSSCGCHVFRRKSAEWELATGVIAESLPDSGPTAARYAHHAHVPDTKDGGSAVWIPEFQGQKMQFLDSDDDDDDAAHAGAETRTAAPPGPREQTPDQDPLPASCACGRVRFHITRPDAASYLPRSAFSDLIYVYSSTDKAITQNPGNEKWWIRAGGTKYLGGTCACRSCRLASGFEIQTWTFVPRANIFFRVPQPDARDITVPLDFATLPAGILTSYRSSPDVLREFCGTCGATVFWHDSWRPDLIDVSVELLRAKEGARADRWVDWWTERVSFAEDTENGRVGNEARRARALIESLEIGLQQWSERAQ
ncbi:hypothetical protein AK830_g350 [Neonectria ditissima]|uniref:CENP-V/GFA domain-containing protein n=1 Tax=Neonectria ditissima TaxID=78410 RepID=A0A0P7BQE7_9HYPO|nr:hypothetical protein AK830_g350 [Neonectria ditissima]